MSGTAVAGGGTEDPCGRQRHDTGPQSRDKGRKKKMLFHISVSFRVWALLTTRTRMWCVGLRAVLESDIPGSLPFRPGLPSYLAVQAQEDEHREEQGGPQWGEGNHGDGLGVSDKGQAGAWRGRREKGAEWSSMPHSVVILSQHVLSASFVPGAGPNSHSNHVISQPPHAVGTIVMPIVQASKLRQREGSKGLEGSDSSPGCSDTQTFLCTDLSLLFLLG